MSSCHSATLGDEAHLDNLPRLGRPPLRSTIRMMRRARTVDRFARWVVDAVVFGSHAQDLRPADFMVVIENAQDIDWDGYAFLGVVPPAGAPRPSASYSVRLVFGAGGGFRVETDYSPPSGHSRVHIRVEAAGAMARGAGHATGSPDVRDDLAVACACCLPGSPRHRHPT